MSTDSVIAVSSHPHALMTLQNIELYFRRVHNLFRKINLICVFYKIHYIYIYMKAQFFRYDKRADFRDIFRSRWHETLINFSANF